MPCIGFRENEQLENGSDLVPNPPWVAGEPTLGEGGKLRPALGGIGDETAGFFDRGRQVEVDGL